MANVNDTELAYARQTGFEGGLVTPVDWRIVERSEIGAFGNTVTKSTPSRISRNRNQRRQKVSAVDSSVEFTAPLDFDSALVFSQGFIMGKAVGLAYFNVSEATATGFVVPALDADQAVQIVSGRTILGVKGLGLEANQRKQYIATSNGTAGDTEITVAGLEAEIVPANKRAELFVAGLRGAVGDIQVDADGNLTSTALDFTTVGLVEGQAIYLGGVDDVNSFSSEQNNGFSIIERIETNKLTLRYRDQDYTADDGAGVQIDILAGPYIRNYARDNPNFVREYYTFSLRTIFEDQATTYEYSRDNACDSISIDISGEFATVSFGFIGSITDNPSENIATGLANAAPFNSSEEYSTSTDLIRLSVDDVDETGLLTDFDSLALTVANGLSARKVKGRIRASQINLGKNTTSIEGAAVFTNSEVIERIRCDKVVSLRMPFWNDDGGMYFRIPQLTLSGGNRNYPEDELVTIQATGTAFNDDIDGSSIEVTMFPVLPTRPCA